MAVGGRKVRDMEEASGVAMLLLMARIGSVGVERWAFGRMAVAQTPMIKE